MTTEEKAQAYDEALKDMRAIYPNLKGDAKLAAEHAFPELAESEDERALRIIKKRMCYDPVPISDEDRRIVENWLEKKKESLHIVETCKENANSFTDEDERIRKGLIELIENWDYPQELFTTKRNIVAYLEKQKEPIDPFDTKLFQDGVKEGRRLEREDIKKEQEPLSTEETELNSIAFLEQLGYTCVPPGAEQKPAEYLPKEKVYNIMTKLTDLSSSQLIPINSPEYLKIHDITRDVRSLLDYPLEQKPAEWSKEDEKIMQTMIKDGDLKPSEIAWLKSRRPSKDCSSCAKNLEGYISGRSDAENKLLEQFGALVTPEDELHIKPRWKPSEEQMQYLLAVINDPNNAGAESCHLILESLYNDLKEL